jgi:hypothetical protein
MPLIVLLVVVALVVKFAWMLVVGQFDFSRWNDLAGKRWPPFRSYM